MIRAVIFDMDGLMYDTEPQLAACWRQAVRHTRMEMTDQTLSALRCRNSPDREKYLRGVFGDRFDYHRMERQVYRRLHESIARDGLPLKSGLWELLVYLRRNGYRLAVQTDNTADTAKWYLELSGCTEFFETLVVGRSVPNGKPEPDIYLKAAANLHLPPQDCLVLEDSPAGVIGAHRAGCPAIMIPDLDAPTRGAESLAAAIVPDLEKVIDFLRVQPQHLLETPLPKFKNVVFDLGGVLVEFDPRRYLNRRFSNKKTESYLYQVIFASEEWRQLDAGILEPEVARAAWLARGKKDGRRFEVQTVLDEWQDHLVTRPQTVSLLRRLKAQGCRLYYLSNVSRETFSMLAQRSFMRLFDGGIVSCETRLLKPDEGIYRCLLDRYGLKAEETVFFDDTRQNVEAARAMGFTGLHFHSAALAEKNLEGYQVL